MSIDDLKIDKKIRPGGGAGADHEKGGLYANAMFGARHSRDGGTVQASDANVRDLCKRIFQG